MIVNKAKSIQIHIHGPRCGHVAVVHTDHIGYLAGDGELHCVLPKRLRRGTEDSDTLNLVENMSSADPDFEIINHKFHEDDLEKITSHVGCKAHEENHVHGDTCGHAKIPHGDHFDYLVGDHLHNISDTGCSDHGTITMVKNRAFPLADIKRKMNTTNKEGVATEEKPWYRDTKTKKYLAMGILTILFFALELGGGFFIGSLALQADAYHMASDVLALGIGFYSMKAAKKQKTELASYGYMRFEILGALVNATFLLAICFNIALEALQRFFTISTVSDQLAGNIDLLIYIGVAGFCMNIFGVVLFSEGHGHSHGGEDHGHGHGGGESHEEEEDHGHSHEGGDHGHAHGEEAHEDDHDHHGHSHEGEDHGHAHAHGEEVHPTHDGGVHVDEIHVDGGDHHGHSHGEGHVHDEEEDEDERMHSVIEDLELGALVKTAKSPRNEQEEVTEKDLKGKEVGKKEKKQKNLNQHAIYLHVLGDALGNLAVIISGLIIKFTTVSWRFYADPVMSLVILCIISYGTYPLFKRCFDILLQMSPAHVKPKQLKEKLLSIEGVLDIHDFHIWQLNDSKLVSTLHLVTPIDCDFMALSDKIKVLLHKQGIHSTTIQPEFVHKGHDFNAVEQCHEPVCLGSCDE